jgi:hypothetical protein
MNGRVRKITLNLLDIPTALAEYARDLDNSEMPYDLWIAKMDCFNRFVELFEPEMTGYQNKLEQELADHKAKRTKSSKKDDRPTEIIEKKLVPV